MYSEEELIARNWSPEMIAKYKIKYAGKVKPPVVAVQASETFDEASVRRQAELTDLEKRLDKYTDDSGNLFYYAVIDIIAFWNNSAKTKELAEAIEEQLLIQIENHPGAGYIITDDEVRYGDIDIVRELILNLEVVPKLEKEAE